MSFLFNTLSTLLGAKIAQKINWSEGLVVFFLGLMVVFAVLLVLIAFFYLLKLFAGNKKEEKKPTQTQVVPQNQPKPEVVTEDEEIVAAITAAISCMLVSEQGAEHVPFVIKKIRHI